MNAKPPSIAFGAMAVGLVMLMFATPLVYIAVAFGAPAMRVTVNGENVIGRIVEVRTEHSTRGKGSCTATIEFTPRDGAPMRFDESIVDADGCMARDVRVRYLLGQPDVARIDNLLQLWFVPIGCGIFGALCLIVAFACFAGAMREWRERWRGWSAGPTVRP